MESSIFGSYVSGAFIHNFFSNVSIRGALIRRVSKRNRRNHNEDGNFEGRYDDRIR